MRNRLFDSIIQTSDADTDDIHSGEAEGNFWAENELFEAVLYEANLSNLLFVSMPLMEPDRTATSLKDFLKNYLYSGDNIPRHLKKAEWIQALNKFKIQAGEPNSNERGFIPASNGQKLTPAQFDGWLKNLENELTKNPEVFEGRDLSVNEIGFIIQYFQNLKKTMGSAK